MARTLSEWLSWQETLHLSSIDLGLDRVRVVAKNLQLLALPCPIISIAGTNGKGSSTAMLQSIYQQAGYKTGVYTSPHLIRYNERIAINGLAASDDAICSAFETIDQARGDISLTYFEFGTLAAAILFAQEKVDVALFEVGLGGRLDAVNLWDADVAVITSIAIDHESWLGNNREDIAIEKAGIMREGCPIISGDLDPPKTIASEAKRIGAQLIQRNIDYSLSIDNNDWLWTDLKHQYKIKFVKPSLQGSFQLDNAANVISVVNSLQKMLPVSIEHINTGLQRTKLLGRLQHLSTCPDFIVDVAHNPQSAEQLALYIAENPVAGKTIAIFSALKDKDLKGIVKPFINIVDEWHIMPLGGERGQSALDIKSSLKLLQINNQIIVYDNFNKAVQDLKDTLKCEDRVVAFGSFLLVSGILESL